MLLTWYLLLSKNNIEIIDVMRLKLSFLDHLIFISHLIKTFENI